jgi:integrase
MNQPEFESLRPTLAIGLFAGIRVEEISRLSPEDIRLDHLQIAVVAKHAKTRRGRVVPVEPVLKEWLETVPRWNFKVSRKLFSRLKRQLGFRWTQNCLRHTFATYWQSQNQNYSQLANRMGNSEEVVARHYVRLTSKTDAEQFWRLTPSSLKPPSSTPGEPTPDKTTTRETSDTHGH